MKNTIIGKDIEQAAAFLRAGELVAMPTETVYGLAADATSETAVRSVFAAKHRPADHPLIVHLADVAQLSRYAASIPPAAATLLARFAPGPLTVLLPGNGTLPPVVNGRRKDIAFRIPAHPLAQLLLRAANLPLVAPSANPFTTISPTHPRHVYKHFNGVIPYILDGGSCTVGIESTVVGFDDDGVPVIYREGVLTAAEIGAVTGEVRTAIKTKDQVAPGMHPRHYAPRTPLQLVAPGAPLACDPLRTGVLCLYELRSGIPRAHQFVLSPDKNPETAARRLYEGLHQLDELGLDQLFAEIPPTVGLGQALNDRLRRAAHIFTPPAADTRPA